MKNKIYTAVFLAVLLFTREASAQTAPPVFVAPVPIAPVVQPSSSQTVSATAAQEASATVTNIPAATTAGATAAAAAVAPTSVVTPPVIAAPVAGTAPAVINSTTGVTTTGTSVQTGTGAAKSSVVVPPADTKPGVVPVPAAVRTGTGATLTPSNNDPLSNLSAPGSNTENSPVAQSVVDQLQINIVNIANKLSDAIVKLETASIKIESKIKTGSSIELSNAQAALRTAKADVNAIVLISIPKSKPLSALPALEAAIAKAKTSIRAAQTALVEALKTVNSKK